MRIEGGCFLVLDNDGSKVTNQQSLLSIDLIVIICSDTIHFLVVLSFQDVISPNQPMNNVRNRSLSFRNEVGKEFPLGIGSEHFPDWHRDMLNKKNRHNIEKKHIHHFKSVDFHTSNIKVWSDPDLTKVVVVKVVLLILQKAMKSGSSDATGDVMDTIQQSRYKNREIQRVITKVECESNEIACNCTISLWCNMQTMCEGNVMDFPGSKSVKWFVFYLRAIEATVQAVAESIKFGKQSFERHDIIFISSSSPCSWLVPSGAGNAFLRKGLMTGTELGPLDGSEITWPLEVFWGKDVLTMMPLGRVFHSLSISLSLSFWTFVFYHLMILLVIPVFTDLYLVSYLQTWVPLT